MRRNERGTPFLAAALVVSFFLGGCAYFNTFYSAKRNFDKAERLYLNPDDRATALGGPPPAGPTPPSLWSEEDRSQITPSALGGAQARLGCHRASSIDAELSSRCAQWRSPYTASGRTWPARRRAA